MEFLSVGDFFRGPTETEKKQLFDAHKTEGQMLDGLFATDAQKPCNFLDKGALVEEGEIEQRFKDHVCDGQMIDILFEKNPDFENFNHMEKFSGPTNESLATKAHHSDGKIIDELYGNVAAECAVCLTESPVHGDVV